MDFLNQGIETHAPDIYPPIPDGISDFLESVDGPPMQSQVSRRAMRWIVIAGNVLPPSFTRKVKEMRMGGENLAQSMKTLTRATNGYLRRCQFTPLSVGKDFQNEMSLGETQADWDKYPKISDWNPKTQKMETRYYIECLPGDELQGLMESQQGGDGIFDKGIREVSALFDDSAIEPGTTQYQNAIRRGLEYQKIIFPDWHHYLNGKKEFFETTAALTNYLLNKRDELADDETAVELIDVLLESNAQYERWATSNLSRMKDTIEAGKQVGEIYNWNERQVMFFKSLELNRESFLEKRTDTPPAPVDTVSRAEFAEQGRKLDTVVNALEVIAPAIGDLAKIAVRDHTPAAEPVAETAETRKFTVGDIVTVKDKIGTVTAKPFGKVTVEFEDKTKESFKPSEID